MSYQIMPPGTSLLQKNVIFFLFGSSSEKGTKPEPENQTKTIFRNEFRPALPWLKANYIITFL